MKNIKLSIFVAIYCCTILGGKSIDSTTIFIGTILNNTFTCNSLNSCKLVYHTELHIDSILNGKFNKESIILISNSIQFGVNLPYIFYLHNLNLKTNYNIQEKDSISGLFELNNKSNLITLIRAIENSTEAKKKCGCKFKQETRY